MADWQTFVYVTFIQATPEQVWHALTDADVTAEYWAEHSNVSDWQVGSAWEHPRTDGSGIVDLVGTVLEAVPPQRLMITRTGPNEERPHGPGRITFDIEPHGDIVRLTVTHENLSDHDEYVSVSAGWPSVLANLKTFLETGHVLSQGPWEMYAEMRDARMARNDPR
ncbi:SRPBCC family protein [Amycolatopsis sp. NPDC051071]|uniref:SRPBCC family protein n=1 Tax=Amycolatopsis sp. NPDC051071 TaxID=3154637 RepID=UPI003439A7CD